MMEGNDGMLNSYYHHHHHHTPTSATNNGIFASPNSNPNNTNASSSTLYSEGNPLGFSHSMPNRAALPEVVKRKRGRPRKYGPGTEPSPPSANNPSPTPSSSSPAVSKKKEPSAGKKAQIGNSGQGFAPHVITVSAGEDVSQKIMSFMQQHKRAICILSANGSISTATLRQQAVLGGSVTYEGRFEILTLSGSFLYSEVGGAQSRTGGLSVCLSGADGRIIGGGVGGPLMAACPVQVIVGSFVYDGKKDFNDIGKADASAGNLPSSPMGGTVVSPMNYRSTPESPAKISVRGNEDHRNMGGSGFVLKPCTFPGIPSRLTGWRSHIESDARSDVDMELTGRTDDGQSLDDGDD